LEELVEEREIEAIEQAEVYYDTYCMDVFEEIFNEKGHIKYDQFMGAINKVKE
jgi:hypothetical protein